MSFRRMMFLLVFGFLIGLGGLVGAQPITKPSKDVSGAAQGNNVFAFDLYAQLNKKEGNLFFSPYSISTALAMTYGGAKGQTAEQMASTLHFGLPPDRFHKAMGELVKHLNAQGQKRPYQLSVANALWGQKGFSFLPEFVKLNQGNYGAGLKDVDFKNQTEEARKIINAWVEKETKDKIKELLKPGVLTSDARLVLTNAIYFKSAWQNEFWKEGTKPADFTLADGTKVQVPTMQKWEKTLYYQGDNFKMVKLPYKDHALSMVILLPTNANGLANLEKSLSSVNLQNWLKKMTTHQVHVKLPRFKTTSEFNLKKVLSSMGMPLAFTPNADFSGMTSEDKLFIGEVVHKAFVDVHEQGTEAAAATAVIMKAALGVEQLPPANFHADHPFTFAIYEEQTGSILFMGRIANPKS